MNAFPSCAVVPALVAAALVAACVGTSPGPAVSPLELDIRGDALPSPGLCRIVSRDSPYPRSQSCDQIEREAPPGSRVLYRPADGSRRIVVCYMSPGEWGVITGADVFNLDTGRNIEVLQRIGEPPPPGGCQHALLLTRR